MKEREKKKALVRGIVGSTTAKGLLWLIAGDKQTGGSVEMSYLPIMLDIPYIERF